MRDLTLSKCINTCQSEEIAEMQMKSMSETSNDYANKIKKERGGSTKNQNWTVQGTMKEKLSGKKYRVNFADLSTCQISGSVQPGKNLQQVQKKNHFAKRCLKAFTYCIESEEEEISIVRIRAMKEKAVFDKMLVNHVHVNFQVDYGDGANILPYLSKWKRKKFSM